MSFGMSPNGTGPFGFAVGVSGTPPPRATPFDAPLIDLGTRDVPVDVDGHYIGTHRVDHAVQMAIGIEFSAIPVDMGVGSTLRDIQIDTTEAMSRDADRRVRRALAALIKAGDIELVSVIASAPAQGRVRVEIRYINLRLPNPDDEGAETALFHE